MNKAGNLDLARPRSVVSAERRCQSTPDKYRDTAVLQAAPRSDNEEDIKDHSAPRILSAMYYWVLSRH
jgi:hypothetical protein